MPLLLLLLRQDGLDGIIPQIMKEDRIPGAIILVGTKDRIIYRRAFGSAKLHSVFDAASCIKVLSRVNP